MSRFVDGIVIACLLLATATPKIYGQKVSPVTGEPIPARKFDFRLNNSTVDDHLIQLARQGNVNFIADATHFPEAPETLSVEVENSLGNLMLEMAYQHRLAWAKHTPGTFLFWADREGDLRNLAQTIVTQQKARLAAILGDPQQLARLTSQQEQEQRWNQEMLPAHGTAEVEGKWTWITDGQTLTMYGLPRHRDGANVLFVDGHTQWLSDGEMRARPEMWTLAGAS